VTLTFEATGDKDSVSAIFKSFQQVNCIDRARTAICDWFVQGMTEYDVMKLASHSEFSTTDKYYLAVRDNLIDRARLAKARGLCKKLVHFGAPPIFGAKEFDRVIKKSLYCNDLSKKRP
jgi:hypothetical protein